MASSTCGCIQLQGRRAHQPAHELNALTVVRTGARCQAKLAGGGQKPVWWGWLNGVEEVGVLRSEAERVVWARRAAITDGAAPCGAIVARPTMEMANAEERLT